MTMLTSYTARKVILAIAILALATPPFIGVNSYALQVLVIAFIYSIAALGLTLVTGITGQIVLGQAALMGIGAYGTALAMTALQLPMAVSFAIGICLAGLTGLLVGFLSSRIKGHYLAITTLGLNEIFRLFVLNEDWLTGGPMGLRDIPTFSFSLLGATHAQQVYLPVLAVALGIYALSLRMYKTRIGRDMRSVRDDDLAAESMGVDSPKTRTTAFVVSSIWAAVAGGLYVMVFGFISPNNFLIFESVRMLLMVVVGGLNSIGGAFLGALVVTILPEALRGFQTYYLAIFGIGSVIILLTVPKGLGIIADWLLAPWLPGDRESPSKIEQTMGGISLKKSVAVSSSIPSAEASVPAEPVLTISNASKAWGGVVALNNVSFEVRKNEILGVIGPNGSGKSTMINACSGIVKLSSGSIRLGQCDITRLAPWNVHAAGVARIFQNVRVWPSMSVVENVMIAHPAQRAVPIISALVSTPRSARAEEEARAAALVALDLVGMRSLAERNASDLSFGQSRLVEIARSIVSRPKLLLLDEPGAGLRGGLILELSDILKQLRAEGMSILVVEHRVKLVMSMCDRIVVLNMGEKIAEGPMSVVAKDQRVIDAYLGQSTKSDKVSTSIETMSH